MSWIIHHGKVEHIARKLEANSFDAMLCDPPYGLAFMGRRWDYYVPSAMTWSYLERTLKPGAPGVIFGGPRTFHRLAVAVEDGGFEIFDLAMWLFGQGFPKSLDISKAIDKAKGKKRKVVGKRHRKATGRAAQGEGGYAFGEDFEVTEPAHPLAKRWKGYGTCLKPGYEPALLVMKYLEGNFASNVERYGCGALNIDDSRVGEPEDKTPAPKKRGDSKSWFTTSDATNLGGDDTVGRFPANVMLDEEAAAMLDEQSGMLKSGNLNAGHKRGRGTTSYDGGGGIVRRNYGGDAGGASRFFYTAKASRAERNAGDVTNDHPTVKPVELIRYFAKMILPPARETPRRILVPYSGSGSEMIACMQAGWDEVVGIEMDERFIEIAKARIKNGGVFSGLLDRKMRRRKAR